MLGIPKFQVVCGLEGEPHLLVPLGDLFKLQPERGCEVEGFKIT